MTKFYPIFTSSCTNLHSHQHKCSPFSTCPSKIIFSIIFDKCPFYPVWGDISLIFICNYNNIKTILYTYWPFICLPLEKCLFRPFCPFFNLNRLLNFASSLYISYINPYQTNDLKIFSIIPCAIFSFVNFLLHCQEELYFDVVQLVYLCFCCLWFSCQF